MSMYGSPPSSSGGTMSNNTPVGSAGQPQNPASVSKKSMGKQSEDKSAAIKRRMANLRKDKKKPKMTGGSTK
jgi:hypothetical protein